MVGTRWKVRLWSHHGLRLVIRACARGLTMNVPVTRGTGLSHRQKHWKTQDEISWKYYRDLVASQPFQRDMTLAVSVVIP